MRGDGNESGTGKSRVFNWHFKDTKAESTLRIKGGYSNGQVLKTWSSRHHSALCLSRKPGIVRHGCDDYCDKGCTIEDEFTEILRISFMEDLSPKQQTNKIRWMKPTPGSSSSGFESAGHVVRLEKLDITFRAWQLTGDLKQPSKCSISVQR